MPSAGQSVPSSSANAVMQGFNGPQVSSGTMGGFMSLQGGPPPGPPSAADVASNIMSSLDTDGDGSISLSEAEANGNADAANAFSALDTNGDGKIDSDELTSAVQSAHDELASAQSDGAQASGGVRHGRHHHHASATDLAAGIMDQADADSSGGLSLDEVSSALGVSSDDAKAGFSALDSNGDGQLSVSELTSAISQYMQSRFADTASAVQSTAVTA